MAPFQTPRDLAKRTAQRRGPRRTDDGFKCLTFKLPRGQAREKARELFAAYPPQAYMTVIESWSELPDDVIEFTVRRLPSAD
jgi:hypothetical protein